LLEAPFSLRDTPLHAVTRTMLLTKFCLAVLPLIAAAQTSTTVQNAGATQQRD